MDLLQQIVARAKADKQRIVLPEAEEERTLKAATSTRLLSLIHKTTLRLRSMLRSSLNFARRRA